MKNLFLMRHGYFKTLPLLFVFIFVIGFTTARAVTIFGATTANQLVRFDSATPGTLTTVGPITGLRDSENIVGIDFRPATGQLFAIGDKSGLYTINKSNGAATLVASLSPALSGAAFGIDFNPTVDRIRIVSNSGQNLRVNPTNGAVTVDGVLNPGTPNVTAAAYTNSFSGSTTTTLFDIDTGSDTLFTQNPPNAGTLVAVGPLGVNATDVNGFDISAADNTAYAALTVAAVTRLYTINTVTGAATAGGLIGTGLTAIRGISVDAGSAAQNLSVYGLTTTNQLVRFNSSRPNTILSTVAITGLQGQENLLGIDFRPATGQLFGLGGSNRIYTINPATGAATQVGAMGLFTLNGSDFGFDFNPLPDRIRVVSDTEQNLRLNPNDGTLSATDGPLAYAVGDPNGGQNPNVVAAAYINSFAGATATTLYDIDSNLDILVTQNPPNSGTLNTVGPLGVNTTSTVGFDAAPGNNTALAAFQLTGDTASKLYSINLTTGAASFIGPIGTAVPLRGIAIGPGSSASTTIDFDGDGRTDYAVFRPSIGNWFINRSSNNSSYNVPFGLAGVDILTPGDYDGDGKTDIAVWRSTEGMFYVLRSLDNQTQYYRFGISGDEPVARDYDGDGKTDFAVVRRAGGQLIWYIANSSNGSFRTEQFGLGTDIAIPGDYDGDGRFDLAVRRGTGSQQAVFYLQQSQAGLSVIPWGLGGDIVVTGDYDGDGRTDLTALRQGTPYVWYILNSSNGGFTGVQFGTKPHLAAQGDYDGDGKTDIAVWDPQAGVFYTLRSTTGATVTARFGQNGDEPVANFDSH